MQNEEDLPSTEEFLALCYKCKLTNDDLEEMTYGDCIDYIDSYLDLHDTNKERVKIADQSDIDRFFG